MVSYQLRFKTNLQYLTVCFIDCPITFVSELRDKKAKLNNDVIFECIIESTLTPVSFKWKKNNEDIDLGNKNKYEYTIENNRHRLVIKNCDLKDQAEYEIYVSDPDDFDISSKAKLEVERGMKRMLQYLVEIR